MYWKQKAVTKKTGGRFQVCLVLMLFSSLALLPGSAAAQQENPLPLGPVPSRDDHGVNSTPAFFRNVQIGFTIGFID